MRVVGQIRSHLWLVNGDDLRGVKSPAPTWNWGPIAVRNYVPRSAGEMKRGVSHLLPNGHLCTKITKIHLFETTLNVVKQPSRPMICANVLAIISKRINLLFFLGWMIIIRIIDDLFYRSSFSQIQQKWSAEATQRPSHLRFLFKKGKSLKDFLQGVV